MKFFGDGGAADHAAPLQHHDLVPRHRQIGGADEAVVPASDDDGVVHDLIVTRCRTENRCPLFLASPCLERGRHLPKRDRAERGRTIREAHRERDAALALDVGRLAEQRQQARPAAPAASAARCAGASPGTARSIAPSAGATRSRPSAGPRSPPIVGRYFSNPAAVTRSVPSSPPRWVSASVPVAFASASPCASRAFWISSRPPAACHSRRRAGIGFGRRSFTPCSTARMSASSGSRVYGPERRRGRAGELHREIDRRIVRP